MRTKKKNLREHASGLADLVAPHVESARDKAGPMLADARDKAGPVLADARDKAGPVLASTRDEAAALMAEAREKAAPVLQDARERFTSEVLPVVTAALAAASEATEDVRGETKKRGKAVAAALKGEVEPPAKSHKLRNVLIALGLGGVAAAVAKKLSAREASTAWQSSYTPPPAPAAAPSPVTPSAPQAGAHKAADDEGGASPDVVAADSAAEPHPATTPDNPAEEVDVTDR